MARPHRKMMLMGAVPDAVLDRDNSPHRPNLSIWFDDEADEDSKLHPINFLMHDMWGQQRRYLELSPLEARQLANHLVQCAKEAEEFAATTNV